MHTAQRQLVIVGEVSHQPDAVGVVCPYTPLPVAAERIGGSGQTGAGARIIGQGKSCFFVGNRHVQSAATAVEKPCNLGREVSRSYLKFIVVHVLAGLLGKQRVDLRGFTV